MLNNWRILPDSLSALTTGLLEILLVENKAGKYTYKISLAKTADVTLNFTLSRQQPTGPCSTGYNTAGAFAVSSHPFNQFTLNGKSYPQILIVKI